MGLVSFRCKLEGLSGKGSWTRLDRPPVGTLARMRQPNLSGAGQIATYSVLNHARQQRDVEPRVAGGNISHRTAKSLAPPSGDPSLVLVTTVSVHRRELRRVVANSDARRRACCLCARLSGQRGRTVDTNQSVIRGHDLQRSRTTMLGACVIR